MTYVKDNQEYTLDQVRALFPRVGIPPGADLTDLGYATLIETPPPELKKKEKAVASIVGNTRVWTVSDKTKQEEDAEAKAKVPPAVTMRQARLALLAAGALTTANGIIAGMSGKEGDAARIEWEYALLVERDSPLVVSMTSMLNLTEAEVDNLFVAASAL